MVHATLQSQPFIHVWCTIISLNHSIMDYNGLTMDNLQHTKTNTIPGSKKSAPVRSANVNIMPYQI